MSTTTARIAGFVVNCIKYLAAFLLALAIPAFIIGDGDPAGGAALLFITLGLAAWYGKRLFGLR